MILEKKHHNEMICMPMVAVQIEKNVAQKRVVLKVSFNLKILLIGNFQIR